MLLERLGVGLGLAAHRLPNDKKVTKIAGILERADELRKLSSEGWGDGRLAQHFGVSAFTIIKARRRLNVAAQPTPNKWSEHKNKILAMLRRGMSRSEIAKELGVTRNAIVGVCHRHALNADEFVRAQVSARRRPHANQLAMSNRNGKPKGRAAGKVRNAGANAAILKDSWRLQMRAKAPPPDSATRCTLMQIKMGRCHYIVDDDNKFYCGAPSETDLSSWCPYHAQFVFQNRMQLSGDVGGSPAAASPTGGRVVHDSVGGQVTARPHPIKEREAA